MNENNLEWINEIDLNEVLSGYLLELAEIIGAEAAVNLAERFKKTTLYFSEKPLDDLKRIYIRKNYPAITARQLARKLGVSERFVFEVVSGTGKNENQLGMFEENQMPE